MYGFGLKVFLSFLLFMVFSLSVWGAESRNRPKGPPPEAVAACEDKSEGDAVEFVGPRGEKEKATCRMFRDQLVAVPNSMHLPPDGDGMQK